MWFYDLRARKSDLMPHNLFSLTMPILDFFGSRPIPGGRKQSQIQNLKSTSPVPLWSRSIQNPKSKIQN
jgi:hypothetical protein